MISLDLRDVEVDTDEVAEAIVEAGTKYFIEVLDLFPYITEKRNKNSRSKVDAFELGHELTNNERTRGFYSGIFFGIHGIEDEGRQARLIAFATQLAEEEATESWPTPIKAPEPSHEGK
jgi:hypothetical protein